MHARDMIPGVHGKERADAARNRQAILDAASALYDAAADPVTVTMDDIAAAAGVGKGTLFRRFGDRRGLLRAVFETRIAALTAAIETSSPPLGPDTPPRERVLALLDAIIEFKLANRQITRALEHLDPRTDRDSFFSTPNYKWGHALFTDLLTALTATGEAAWIAHALLSFSRIDLIEHLVTVEGWTGDEVREHVREIATRILDGRRSPAGPGSAR
jgi:AcrR family transcriptional regulator